MRIGFIFALPLCLGACASDGPAPAALASKAGAEPVPAERVAPAVETKDTGTLNWKRLEVAVAEAARDKRLKTAPESVHNMAVAYARDINRIPVEQMKQFHIDRATVVLERDVFSGETIAEGAALRATVNGGGGSGGRTQRNARDNSRTSRTSNNSSNSGNNNRSNNSNNNNSSGF